MSLTPSVLPDPRSVRRFVAAALLVAACGPGLAGPSAGRYPLQAIPDDRRLCAGWGLGGDFALSGSPDDSLRVWLTEPDGSRRDLVWPAGSYATFEPEAVVHGPDGAVIAFSGAQPTGACPMGRNGEWLLEFDVKVEAAGR